jgi:hypothetical protein
MVGAHLLKSQLDIDVLKYLLQDLHHLVGLEVIAYFLSWILDPLHSQPGCTYFFSGVTLWTS